MVGNVPTGFSREPHYYRKELELKMSCSYGPGRYDPGYEEKGIDYPAGYVRWTERRNMEAFQDLVHSGKISIDYLTTHVFKLEDAPKAYDMILNKTDPHLGIMIEYNQTKKHSQPKIAVTPHSELRTPNFELGKYCLYRCWKLCPGSSPSEHSQRRGYTPQRGYDFLWHDVEDCR